MCVIYNVLFMLIDFFVVILPSPKVLQPPHSLSTAIGSKAVFTCNFEAAADKKITQIHWLFNGRHLAECSIFKDSIDCKVVTKLSTDKNYISSNLTIYPVQADNAGQYTCYCSYNTSLLNVDSVQVIESEHKSATLSVPQPNKKLYLIIGISSGISIITIVFIIIVLKLIHYKFHRKKYREYVRLEQYEEGKLHKCMKKSKALICMCIAS